MAADGPVRAIARLPRQGWAEGRGRTLMESPLIGDFRKCFQAIQAAVQDAEEGATRDIAQDFGS